MISYLIGREVQIREGNIIKAINLEGSIINQLMIAGAHQLVGQAKNLCIGKVTVPENYSFY